MSPANENDLPLRLHSLRWKRWRYSRAGAYFVTICVAKRRCLLGRIDQEVFVSNRLGDLVRESWAALSEHYAYLELGPFIVMPNHVHGVIGILEEPATPARVGFKPTPTDDADATTAGGAGFKPARHARRHGLPEVVRAFKTFSARRINQLGRTPGQRVWQRGYHDRVIRTEREYQAIAKYIDENPAHWAADRENPETS